MDKPQLEQEVRQGRNAQRIIDDPLFKSAIQHLRDKAVDDFKAAPASNPELLQMARLRFTVTEDFVNAFVKVVRDGEFAARVLEEKAP